MSRSHDQKGITLLELLIAVVILVLVLAGVYVVFQGQERSYVVQNQVTEMNQNARIALEIMSREIRNAVYDPTRIPGSTGTGAGAAIKVANGNSIVYTSDEEPAEEPDGAIADTEWSGFRFNGSTIEYCVKATNQTNCTDWEILVDNIQGLQFSYTLADGTTTSTPASVDDVREVEIQVVVRRKNQFGGGFESRILTSRVEIRNLILR
jgi:type IV pilus assembly protein PilW